jgi:hypothetical protein
MVRTGRTRTIVLTCAVLVPLAWALRVLAIAALGDEVIFHEAPAGDRLAWFALVSTGLIACLVFACLNRILLHAVAWCIAGAAANVGELVATGAVADYIPLGVNRLSPGDVYLIVGLCLLALAAGRIVRDGARRSRTA